MSGTRRPRLNLVAVDRARYRRYSHGLTYAVEDVNPELAAAIIAEAAWTIAREWTRRYGVPFPWDRIDWRIVAQDEAETLRQLAAAKAVHG